MQDTLFETIKKVAARKCACLCVFISLFRRIQSNIKWTDITAPIKTGYAHVNWICHRVVCKCVNNNAITHAVLINMMPALRGLLIILNPMHICLYAQSRFIFCHFSLSHLLITVYEYNYNTSLLIV